MINWSMNVNGDVSNNEALRKLALKMFNMVIGAFEKSTSTLDKVYSVGVDAGVKTHQFIMYGDMDEDDLQYHSTPGSDYNRISINQNEKTISLDARPTVASFSYDNIDQLNSSHDKKAYTERKAQQTFARSTDKKNFVKALEGSEQLHPVTGEDGGNIIIEANFGSDVTATVNTLNDIVTDIENKELPLNEIFFYFTPALFNWCILNLKDYIVNKDVSDGSQNLNTSSSTFEFAGLTIVKSPSLGRVIGNNVTSVAGNTAYAYDATNSLAIGFHKMSVGNLIRQSVDLFYVDDRARNGTELVTMQMQNGIDWLNPNGIYQIRSAV